MSTVQSLSYIVTQVQSLEAWRHYAEEVLGMMTTIEADGTLRIKMDERPFRILVQEGATDVYLASGWELASEEDFNAMLEQITEQGVSYELGDRALCVSRGVQAVASLADPAGNRHELSWGHISGCQPFVSPQGVPRFVTDGMGLGHTVLPAPNFDECAAFYRDVLGFRNSDIFNFRPDPAADATRIHFMHCGNARHHSLAIAEYDVPSKCVHMMVEVDSMSEVGRAHDRRAAHGVPLSATLGQHLNDKMTSFYMKTPSGFDLEFGWGGLLVDWDKHSVFEFNRVSVWGHDFSVGQQGETE
ncbi:MAG: VOC family protein [Pseudomonas sp.]|jgi:3,4-dihydroxy-9,10-secoandrosta-1,3,5(10)-triene-9,17-dione 4,5-dioxygenase|nr:VOC family protein [Pseudomonas sp.]MDY0415970.1 VOC family protein [Pseudomonas sp.]